MNDIILYLHYTPGKVTKSALIDVFNISLNTLNEYIQHIEFFIKENHFENDLMLTIHGDQLSLEKSRTFPIKSCIQIFLEHSVKYQIINHLFERGQIQSELFQTEYNISPATYYRRITELNELLKEFRLTIKRRQLIGEEKQIRYFFFNFYWLLIEDKTEFEKETSNQYLGLIHALSRNLDISFEPAQILQIKLWMKISFKRMTRSQNFIFDPNYDNYDRPMFIEINKVFVEYMVKSDRNYSVYEAYMFYDFFVSMRNFPPTGAFAFRLANAQKIEESYLTTINQTVLRYLKEHHYISPNVSEKRLRYIEQLLYQFHSHIYYFDGVLLNFDTWGSEPSTNLLKKPYTVDDVQQLIDYCQEFFSDYRTSNAFSNKLARINYMLIFAQLAEFNQENVTIAVYQSLNPYYRDLVIQNVENSLGGKYPLQVIPYQENLHYDILLSNITIGQSNTTNNNKYVYIYTDFSNAYDHEQIEKLIHELSLQRNSSFSEAENVS